MRPSALATSALIAVSSAVAVDSNRKAPMCGSKGYDTNTEGYFYGTQGTYSGCSAQCQKDSKNCKSFSFGDGECNLYAVAVAGNFYPASDSPYSFYDYSCVSSATSAAGTTSTKSSKSSTTSATKSTTSTIVSIKTTSTVKTIASTPTTKTTTKSSSDSVSTSSTISSSTNNTPPCPLPTFVVTNFKYFNSSHNCDCADSRPDVGDGTGCLDPNGNWCDPRYDQNCTHCGIGVCYTGLGTQPVGYGPPDTVSADISNIGSCYQSNPGTTPLRPVSGGNVVRCGGSQLQWTFNGDSNKAKSTAYFNMQNQYYCPDGKAYYMAYGQGQAAMSCSYDSQKNATCVLTDLSFAVHATRYDNVGYYGSSN